MSNITNFENVTVPKQTNIYFDGKVVSNTVLFEDGSKKTLGVMQIGTYNFGTDLAEIMEIMSGNVNVKPKNEDNFTNYQSNTTFDVKANSSFDIEVLEVTSYCCSYIK
jgi:uncharacterized protein YaiE (UPF0345 family)